MTSSTRAFFVGVGTTIVILAVGFGGGLMLAKSVMEPTPPGPSRALAGRLPPARVILPSSAEAAAPPELSAAAPETATQILQPQTVQPLPIPTKEVQQAPEKDRQAERAERRKAEAEERERRKRTAERKARREAARIAQQQQSQQRPGIMAFGGDSEQPSFSGGLFGN